jgi:hypothetical protein
MPKVSVIIPCQGAAPATLQGAVLSALDQDFADIEVLVIDDGSAKTAAALARRLAMEDARLRVVVQADAGLAEARNRGIKESFGEVIAFLDADDRWEKDLLRRHLINFEVEPASGVSFARLRVADHAMRHSGGAPSFVRQPSLARILGDNPIRTASNLVARRCVFAEAGGFDTSLAQGHEQEWAARVLATTAWQVSGLPHILVEHRTRPLLRDPADLERARETWMFVMRRVRSYAPAAVARVEAEASALFHLCLARRALGTGLGRLSLRPLLQALRASPRTLLRTQPHRTAITIAGVLATLLHGKSAISMPTL